jgi:hypothetical protein
MQAHERQLPRVVVFLCEYLLDHLATQAKARAHSLTPETDTHTENVEYVANLLQEDVDSDMFEAVRERFDQGELYDCRSPVCMFRVFKAFLRELPAPLIPAEQYHEFVDSVNVYLQVCPPHVLYCPVSCAAPRGPGVVVSASSLSTRLMPSAAAPRTRSCSPRSTMSMGRWTCGSRACTARKTVRPSQRHCLTPRLPAAAGALVQASRLHCHGSPTVGTDHPA